MDIKLVSVFVLCLVASLAYSDYKQEALKEQLRDWQNVAAERDSLLTVTDTIVQRQALELKNIEIDNKDLREQVEALDGDLATTVNLLAKAQASLENIETVSDTIIINNETREVRNFSYADSTFGVAGFFELHDPYRISIPDLSVKIELDLAILQEETGAWQTLVDSKDPRIKISRLTASVSPYSESFWEKISYGGGVYSKGVIGSIGFDSHRAVGLIGVDGVSFGYIHDFK